MVRAYNVALGLSDRFRVTPAGRYEDHDRYRVDFTPGPTECPYCGGDATVHGRVPRCVFHLPLRLTPTVLEVNRARMRCTGCGRTFWYDEGLVCPTSPHMTPDLELAVRVDLVRGDSVRSISERYGPGEGIVGRVIDSMDFGQVPHLPLTLCADEFKADTDMGKYAVAVSNGDSASLLDVLPSKRSGMLEGWLMSYSLRERERVRYFCCDMCAMFRNEARSALPNATICADKFHVIKDACRAMTKVRVRLEREELKGEPRMRGVSRLLLARVGNLDDGGRGKLEGALSCSDELRGAHGMLQNLYLWADLPYSRDMERQFGNWRSIARNSGIPEFVTVAGTYRTWRKEILDAWRYGKTNACAEGLNNRIKVLKRNCYGIRSFATLRKRCLLTLGPVRIEDHAVALPKPGTR